MTKESKHQLRMNGVTDAEWSFVRPFEHLGRPVKIWIITEFVKHIDNEYLKNEVKGEEVDAKRQVKSFQVERIIVFCFELFVICSWI